MTARVGPVSAKFRGRLSLSDIKPPHSYSLAFEGQGGAAGFAKGGAQVKLFPEKDQTKLVYDVKANVGGKLAQIGSRLVDAAAKKVADEFFNNFNKRVSAVGEDTTVVIAAEPAHGHGGAEKAPRRRRRSPTPRSSSSPPARWWCSSSRWSRCSADDSTLLFREDPYLRVLRSDRRRRACGDGVELDRTVFYPMGGGQAGDTGTLGAWRVLDTRKGAGGDSVLHVLEPGAAADRRAEAADRDRLGTAPPPDALPHRAASSRRGGEGAGHRRAHRATTRRTSTSTSRWRSW